MNEHWIRTHNHDGDNSAEIDALNEVDQALKDYNNISEFFDDWFFPSKDELDAMYTNLHEHGGGGFADASYWSSSEINSNNAWLQDFNNGNQTSLTKFASARVRAVRAFTNSTIYNLRDIGPSGGLIFHIVGNTKYEAAPEDFAGTYVWGDGGTEIGATAQGTAIGTGQSNTTAIVAHMEGKSITGTPAQVCDAYVNPPMNTSSIYREQFELEVTNKRIPVVYPESTANETDFPIGHIISVLTGSTTFVRNASTTIRLATVTNSYTISGSGAILTGTWRARGYAGHAGSTSSRYFIFQRTA